MRKILTGFGAAVVVAVIAQSASAEIYVRKGGQEVNVSVKDGRLFCTRVSDGYEMCNGMTEQANGSWTGRKMKHPDMPRFMSFNGTVVFMKDSLSIKGCALGFCDSETWQKK